MARLRLIAVAVALVLIPAYGLAQDVAAPRTHTVIRGNTLWGIAAQYFNDPFLWPEIYRVNTDVVEDPHWIYPGEILRIPDIAALRRPSRDEMPDEPVAPVRQRPIFTEILTLPPTAVRSGEYLKSPFIVEGDGIPGAGRILSEATGPRAAQSMGNAVLQFDLLVIEPPAGVNTVVGDRFLAVRLTDKLPNRSRVVEPVGVVYVENAANAAGARAIASMRDMFHAVHVGDWLIPMDTLVARTRVYPAAVEPSISGKVIWLQRHPELASIGDYVILDVGARDGVVTGDQFTLVRSRGRDKNGVALPEEPLAIAQVHRVTTGGATALIIHVVGEGIAIGTVGRLTAKMP